MKNMLFMCFWGRVKLPSNEVQYRIWEKKESKDSRLDSGHSHFSYARYTDKLFTTFKEICMETPCWPETNRNICH